MSAIRPVPRVKNKAAKLARKSNIKKNIRQKKLNRGKSVRFAGVANQRPENGRPAGTTTAEGKKRKRNTSSRRDSSSDSDNEPDEGLSINKKKIKKSTGTTPGANEGESPDNETVADVPQPSLIEMIAGRRRLIDDCRQKVGEAATAIIANPSANLKRLKFLITMLDHRNNDITFKLAFVKMQSLIAYSLLEVFKDILPTYKIKEDGEEDVHDKKLKKETRELRSYELQLLKYYRLYINRLQKMTECLKKKKKNKSSGSYERMLLSPDTKETIAVTGTRCLCGLMLSLPHFNYTPTIIAIIVPLMTSRTSSLKQISFQSTIQILREDKSGEVSMLVVRSAGKVIKSLKQNVDPLVVQSFLYLNISNRVQKDDSFDLKRVREQNKQQSKKERKHNKELLKLKNEMKEIDAREDQEKKNAIHAQILEHIFFVYFRFIKDFIESDVAFKNSDVMTPVMEGLSKFAHQINIDFFDDLISLLYRLAVSQRLTDVQSLHCLNTVFTILSGDGSAINIDPQRFYTMLYTAILSFDVETCDENLTSVFIRCFDQMLVVRKKQQTFSRVLGYCKRLSTMALQTSAETSAVLLSCLRILMRDHPKTDLLIDTEYFGTGNFDPSLSDPEFCNAAASRLWELHLLRKHYDPDVAKSARNQTYDRKKIAAVSLKTPSELFHELSSRSKLEDIFPDGGVRKYNKSK